jgi:hypothetical protein
MDQTLMIIKMLLRDGWSIEGNTAKDWTVFRKGNFNYKIDNAYLESGFLIEMLFKRGDENGQS